MKGAHSPTVEFYISKVELKKALRTLSFPVNIGNLSSFSFWLKRNTLFLAEKSYAVEEENTGFVRSCGKE